jgi:tRNA(fMet)-specific endonuclease VapC
VNYILDTNVISELVAAQPNPNVIHWLESAGPDEIFLSAITVGELKKGIEKLPKSKRKDLLNQWLNDDLLTRFQGHILPIDENTMLCWGTLNARLEVSGRPMPVMDGLLAASALQHRFTLVTRNADHFKDTGILLFNPWE